VLLYATCARSMCRQIIRHFRKPPSPFGHLGYRQLLPHRVPCWAGHVARMPMNWAPRQLLDGRSHQTGDAAFKPATPHDLPHSRANTDSHNLLNTQHTRANQKTHCFMQKDTQPSQACSGGHITPNPTRNRCG
jgi:hypothetical protein